MITQLLNMVSVISGAVLLLGAVLMVGVEARNRNKGPTPVSYRWHLWLASILSMVVPHAASAGQITAEWVKDTKTGSDTYRWTDPGSGDILIFNAVPGASTRTTTDTRAGTPASFDNGSGTTLNAIGVSKPKSTLVPTSDSWGTSLKQTAAVAPQPAAVTSSGKGEWTATPTPGAIAGTNVVINYKASTDITPLARVAPISLIPYAAYTRVRDPFTLLVLPTDSPGVVPFTDTMQSLSISLPEVGGFSGIIDSHMTLNDVNLYSMTINVMSDFTENSAAGGILINYFNMDGTRNTAMESAIRANLDVNVSSRFVGLLAPMDIFKGQLDRPSAGSYQIGSDMMAGVAVAVPEPSSLVTLGLGLAGLAGYAGWRRVRPRRVPSRRVAAAESACTSPPTLGHDA